MLLAIDFDKDFIDVEGVALNSMFALQPASIYRSGFYTPTADGFATDGDTPLSEKIFNEWSGTPAVAEVESLVEPDSIRNDIWWESMTFVYIHRPIIEYSGLSCQYRR